MAALHDLRPVGLARLHPAQPHRRAASCSGWWRRTASGGVTSNPAIFEKAIDGSDDYAAAIDEISEGARPRRQGGLRAPRRSRTSRTRPTCCVRSTTARQAQRRLREPRGVARPRERHGGHAGRGAAALEDGGAAQRDDQGAGHARGHARHPHADRAKASTSTSRCSSRARPTRRWRTRTSRPRSARGRGPAVGARRQRRQLLREPHRHARSTRCIEEKLKTASGRRQGAARRRSCGKVAIANAKLAYQSYKRIFAGPRWEALRRRARRSQRVLWASTGTKNPHYSDVLYVEELIGPDTVNTVPPGDARRVPRPRPPARQPRGGRRRAPRTCSTTSSRPASRWTRSPTTCWRTALKKFVEPFTKLLERRGAPAAARPTRPASTRRPHALPAALAGGGRANASRTGTPRAARAGCWPATPSLWTGSRRGELDRLARHRGRSSSTT